jgi:hypothetical protein
MEPDPGTSSLAQGENAVKKDNEASSWWMENYLYCCNCIHDDLLSSIGSALGYSGYMESAAALLVLIVYLSLYGSERRRLHISLQEIKNIALGQIEIPKVQQQPGHQEEEGSAQAEVLVRLKAQGAVEKGTDEKEEHGEVLRARGKALARGPRGPSGIVGEADEGGRLPGCVCQNHTRAFASAAKQCHAGPAPLSTR